MTKSAQKPDLPAFYKDMMNGERLRFKSTLTGKSWTYYVYPEAYKARFKIRVFDYLPKRALAAYKDKPR